MQNQILPDVGNAFARAFSSSFAPTQKPGNAMATPQGYATPERNNALASFGGPTQGAANALSGGDMEQQIYQGLIARGLPPHVAEGFVLNMKDESGLNPGINEISPLVPGSRGGFGLYQLTGPRRRDYEAFASQTGAPLDSVDAQLDFLMQELSGSEKSAASRIMSSTNTGEAATAIVNSFLRPAPEHRASRSRRYAQYGG